MQKEVFWRWLKTTAVLLVTVNAGMTVGTFGTTFPVMASLMSVANGQMATTLTWIGISSIVGTLCMGPLFDRFDGLLLLSCGLLLQGLALGMAPWCRVLIGFQFMAGICALFCSGVISGGLCVNSKIWKNKPEMLKSITQMNLFALILGSAIAPQLMAQFIGAHRSPDIIDLTTAPQDSYFKALSFDSTTGNSSGGRDNGPEPVQMGYLLVSCINLLTAAAFFVVCALDRVQARMMSCEHRVIRIVRNRSYSLNEEMRSSVEDEFPEEAFRERTASLDRLVPRRTFKGDPMRPDEHGKLLLNGLSLHKNGNVCLSNGANAAAAVNVFPDSHAVIGNLPLPSVSCNWNITPLVTIVLLFFIVTGSTDVMFNGLLFTFLNGYLHWTPQDGALLVTAYQVTRLVAQAVVVLLARFTSPTVLVVLDIIILVTSSIFMLVTVNAGSAFIVTAVLLTAVAMSNLTPSSLNLARRYLQVDGKVIGMFLGAVFVGFSAMPPIAALLLDSYGVVSFPAILLSNALIQIVLFSLWMVVAKTVRHRQDIPPVIDVVLPNERTPLIRS